MQILTEKDDQGNWCLKGVRWEQLRTGQVITKDVAEKLYGALCKLRAYEDTGVHPDTVETLMEKYAEAAALLTVPMHSWIPVSERLPDEDDGCDTCSSQDLFVNAWMPLPKPYEEDETETERLPEPWATHYRERFEKVK